MLCSVCLTVHHGFPQDSSRGQPPYQGVGAFVVEAAAYYPNKSHSIWESLFHSSPSFSSPPLHLKIIQDGRRFDPFYKKIPLQSTHTRTVTFCLWSFLNIFYFRIQTTSRMLVAFVSFCQTIQSFFYLNKNNPTQWCLPTEAPFCKDRHLAVLEIYSTLQ